MTSTQNKRRREGKTDYKKRLALLKSKMDRFAVRVLSRSIIAQIISYNPKGDIVKTSASSIELRKLGYSSHTGNAKAAYLTGYLCGKRARQKNIQKCILDIGLHTPVKGSNVFATLKGAIDAGLNIPHSSDILPNQKRLENITEIKQKIDESEGGKEEHKK